MNEEKSQEKSYYQLRLDFGKKFVNKISPLLAPFEKERKAILPKAICAAILIIIVVYIFFFKLFGQNFGGVFISLLFFIVIIAKYSFSFFPNFNKSFENRVKAKIMPIICSCFENLKWQTGYDCDLYLIEKSCVISEDITIPGTSLTVTGESAIKGCDDVFKGSYKGIPFEIIETTNGCKGCIIVKLDIDKKFSCHTVIMSSETFSASPNHTLKRTSLEDVKFEKQFKVYTDDEMEARYLINPGFMERLMYLKVVFCADAVSCAFYKGSMYVALYTHKDLFALSLFKPLTALMQYDRMLDEIISIYKLIDHFKLNENTGL